MGASDIYHLLESIEDSQARAIVVLADQVSRIGGTLFDINNNLARFADATEKYAHEIREWRQLAERQGKTR